MSKICLGCGNKIHPLRVKFLENKGLSATHCVECSTEQKVGGFMSTEGKTERTLIIAPMDTVDKLHNLSARAGTGVSRGVKMSRSFGPIKTSRGGTTIK